MLGLKIAIVCFVVLADMSGGKVVANDPAPVVVQETQAQETRAQETQAIPTAPKAEGFEAYSIYGVVPPVEWQEACYRELCAAGIGWYWPYAVCQIWQESCWNRWSDNGRDKGITQQKAIYWESRSALYGIAGADIWDVVAQFHVFAGMMRGFLAETGNDVGMALSAYYLGTWDYSETYVNNVMDHWDALGVVR